MPIGNSEYEINILERRSEKSKMIPPIKAAAGIKFWWLGPNISLDIWGVIKPINPIIPQ